MKKIGFSLCLFILFSVCNAQKYNLSLNLSKNKTYTHTTCSNLVINQIIDNKPFDVTMSITATMAYKVTEIKDSVYTMEVKYKSLKMSITLMDKLTEYSSNKDDETDIMSTMFGLIIDKPFFVNMTKSGKIREIRNIDTVFSGILENFPSLSNEQKEQLKEQLKQSYGEKAFKGSIEILTAIFPEKKVSLNEKWKINTKLGSGFDANLETIFELIEVNEDNYIIAGTSDFNTINKDAYTKTNGKEMKYELNGTQRSNIKIDRKTGWIIVAETTQNTAGTAYIKSDEEDSEDMVVPITLKTEITIKK